jgi:hypothetical protein
MESLKYFHDYLENLQYQARKLASAGLSLNNLLAGEAKRLNQEDEASRLRALYRAIVEQLERVKRNEGSASYGHSQVKLMTSWGGLVVGTVIKITSKDKRLSAFSDHLLKNLGGKDPPFSMVLVCIGSQGLPDGVEVVSISRLARESNREESEVINELQQGGCLLFSEKAFSLLIDKLINDVQGGRLLLPITTEKLSQLKPSSRLKLKAKNSE